MIKKDDLKCPYCGHCQGKVALEKFNSHLAETRGVDKNNWGFEKIECEKCTGKFSVYVKINYKPDYYITETIESKEERERVANSSSEQEQLLTVEQRERLKDELGVIESEIQAYRKYFLGDFCQQMNVYYNALNNRDTTLSKTYRIGALCRIYLNCLKSISYNMETINVSPKYLEDIKTIKQRRYLLLENLENFLDKIKETDRVEMEVNECFYSIMINIENEIHNIGYDVYLCLKEIIGVEKYGGILKFEQFEI